jgi:omega-6 fatty acid desaturase (delta-12 desaturase)
LIQSDTRVANWKPITGPYEEASVRKAIWQIVNTFGPYILLWVFMYHSHAVSWWLSLPLAVLAGGLLVRIFIILHDCGHGSFFPSRLANDFTGAVAGVLTFTPYNHWRGEHSQHHATSGDLDRRGIGDVWTMTVREYLESSRWKRSAYRLVRNPFVLFALAPLFLFVIGHRFSKARASFRERKSVWWTNLALCVLGTTLAWLFGFVPYVLIQLTILLTAGATGVWLFYVQHQFDGAYWERTEDWDYTAAALEGSSFYRLPGILQWLTGNIGFHHIHHLSSRIPNYNLKRCHQSHAFLRDVKALTLVASFGTARLRLWDERRRELVSFRDLKQAGRSPIT